MLPVGAHGSPRCRKGDQKWPQGSPRSSQGGPRAPQGTPKAPKKSFKMVPGARPETPQKRIVKNARGSSESTIFGGKLQYTHEKTSIQKTYFSRESYQMRCLCRKNRVQINLSYHGNGKRVQVMKRLSNFRALLFSSKPAET